jgi:hypothetical protein
MDFKRSERIALRLHPELNEKWVQELIAADPSIIGLGDLVLREKERIQPRAGRLDLLLQDLETKRRYEVEIQLGPTDEIISFALSNIGTLRGSAIPNMNTARSSLPRTSLAAF